MLIIAVVVGVCIKIAKTKLGKITSYTYNAAYLTVDSVSREMFKDFSPKNTDYTDSSVEDSEEEECFLKTEKDGKTYCNNYKLVSACNVASFNCNNYIGQYGITSDNCPDAGIWGYGSYLTEGKFWQLSDSDFGSYYSIFDQLLEKNLITQDDLVYIYAEPGMCTVKAKNELSAGSLNWCNGKTSSMSQGCGWGGKVLYIHSYIIENEDKGSVQTLPLKGENFCKLFVSYTNTSAGLIEGGEECKGDSIGNSLTDFSETKPDIILRNGIRIYNASQNPIQISELADNTQKLSLEGIDNTNEWGYVLYVDIDGQKGLNKLWEDVYPFYVTLAGYVIPAYDKENPSYSGGDSIEHLQTSVLDEYVGKSGLILNWITKSKSFKESACKSGYVGTSTPYCSNPPAFSIDSNCSDDEHDCRLKKIVPIKGLF